MASKPRSIHIDALRGLAVLLMVLVHAAATWEPPLSGNAMLLGIVVSAGGGLAAPLFVALLGWGLFQRQLSGKQRVWRAGCLFACQLAVNLSAPHLFEPWTPGVLSLMGLLILTETWWGQLWHRSSPPQRTFSGLVILVLLFLTLFGTSQGPSNWDARVSSESAAQWFGHLIMTGLYPLIPWVVFAAFGMTIASLQGEDHRTVLYRRVSGAGFLVSLIVLVDAIRYQKTWALPTGDASLTFFPANAPFIIAALTGTALLWWVAERTEVFTVLSDLGRVSLTVYVLHFLPMTLFQSVDETHSLSSTLTSLLVVAYTLGWMVLGSWLHRRVPHLTLEALMKRREPS